MSQGTDDSSITQKTNTSEKTGRPPNNGGSKTATGIRQDDTVSTHSGLTPSVASHREKYKELEQALNNQQTQLNKGLTNMETQLKKLQRLDDLETKMMKSMQHHVDTNNTLRQVQDQMEKMMIMLHAMNEGTKRTAKRSQQASRTVTQHPTMEESTLDDATVDGSQAPILHQDIIPIHEMEEESTHSQAGLTDSGTTASSSSSSTNVRPPDRKKQRSVHDELEKLSLDTSVSISNDTEKHPSTVVSPSPRETQSPAATEVLTSPTIHMEFDDDNSSMDSAPSNLDDQYKSSRDPDGGENG
jgi:hypothetical protein